MPFTSTPPDLTAPPIRVTLADDHPIALRGMHALLTDEPGIAVIDACADADSAAASIARYQPDVALLDLNMPGTPVLDIVAEMRERHPGTQIVIMTMARELSYARRALAAGAAAYVLKDGTDDDVVTAVRAAAAGRRYLNPKLAAKIAALDDATRPGGLSGRQVEILRLLALGHTNAEIGRRLHLSIRTVESHRAHILAKLQTQGRHELVEFALDYGLIRSERVSA